MQMCHTCVTTVLQVLRCTYYTMSEWAWGIYIPAAPSLEVGIPQTSYVATI